MRIENISLEEMKPGEMRELSKNFFFKAVFLKS
jgi:hypothetical protein